MTAVDLSSATDKATLAILNSPTLVMGLTRSGKSSLLATAAEYIWETYRKVSLYYTSDGGGFPTQMQALINRGIVRVWRMRTRSAPNLAYETCQRASQGWWPARIKPMTGEVEPNVKLVPPLTVRTLIRCPNGHLVKAVRYRSEFQGPIACPECKTPVTAQNYQTEQTTTRTKGFEEVGGALYDGLSSQCSWMMEELGERMGRNELGGEKGNLGTIVSGDFSVGSVSRACFGSVQTRAEAMVLNSGGIPDLVIPPIWTALTAEGSDEGSLPVVGPLIAGQAKTAVAAQWFGDSMETIVVETPDGKKLRRLYLQMWMDDKNRRHTCGVRSYPRLLPDILEEVEDDENAAPFTTFNLGHFYRLREQARLTTEAEYARKYADAPGVPSGIQEYGDVGEVASSSAPAPAPTRPAPPPPARGARPAAAGARPAPTGAQPARGAVGTAQPSADTISSPAPVVPAPVAQPSAAAPAPAVATRPAPAAAPAAAGPPAPAPAPALAAKPRPAPAPAAAGPKPPVTQPRVATGNVPPPRRAAAPPPVNAQPAAQPAATPVDGPKPPTRGAAPPGRRPDVAS